jgi:hypothetical protein
MTPGVPPLTTGQRWILVGVFALGLAGIALALWSRGRVDPVPPPVRAAVQAERADRARDSAQLVAATLEAEAAARRQEEATARARSAEERARVASDRADALARRAELAESAQDSARYYRLAYEARTAERDTLLDALAAKDTALDAADDRIAAITRGAVIANSARIRADSVLDAVVASVVVCTVPGTFGRVRCPSRRTALVVGLVAGVAIPPTVRAIRDGRLRLSLPFQR